MEHLAGQYFLNTDLRADEIREQIGELCRAGYECIFLHARAGLKTPYLSEDWFKALSAAVDELVRHGVKFAIWDEDNFPSGDAGNRICNSWPELASSCLKFHIVEAKKNLPILEYFSVNGSFIGCYAVDGNGTITDISGHCGTLRSQWNPAIIRESAYSPYSQLPYPHRRRSMNVSRFALSWTPDRDCRIVGIESVRNAPGGHSGDLLNPETTRRLIDLIHSEYERHFPEQLKHCAASFMDEPAPGGIYPWTRRLPEEFKQDHGCDLIPLLPHLAMDIDGRSVRIRNDYRKTLHRLLCRNYLEPVKKWLNARNILSTGHLTRSEYLSWSGLLWPDDLRCFKYFDIPCCDPLGAGIGQMGASAHHIGVKTVSSAARLFGKKAAGADAFAVGGDTISLRDLKFMLDYHLVMGITWFNVHGLYYTLDGERRDEAPPSLFYQHSQWPHMPEFLRYLKQRCGELSGEHICNLEMLYPSTALQSRLPGSETPDAALHEFAERLLSRQRDFELIDEITLHEQSPEEFAAVRPYFAVAHAPWIEASTARWLEAYAAAGGTVLVEGASPRILPGPDETSGKIWNFAESCREPDSIERIPAPELIGDHSCMILIRRIRRNGKVRTFLFNRGSGTFRGSFEGTEIELAPGKAGFSDELGIRKKVPVLPLSGWILTFGSNSVPLHYWKSSEQSAYDLLAKTNIGWPSVPETGEYYAVFMLDGPLSGVMLTSEEETLARGGFRLNGTPLTDFKKAVFRDCRERECDISTLLKPGRNMLVFTGRLFENAPYLRGRFQAEFPLGNCGYPVLRAAPEAFHLDRPQDYRTLGYGTYSGKAFYRTDARIAESGCYMLDLNLVRDSVRIVIDGIEQGILIAPPYQWETELAAGKHRIELEVCNAPGNRDVLAGLPAGLQS